MHVINDILLPFVFSKNKDVPPMLLTCVLTVSGSIIGLFVCFLFILHSVDVAFRFVLGV